MENDLSEVSTIKSSEVHVYGPEMLSAHSYSLCFHRYLIAKVFALHCRSLYNF